MANKERLRLFKNFTRLSYPHLHAMIIAKVGDGDETLQEYRNAWIDCAAEYDHLNPGFLAEVAAYAQRIINAVNLSEMNDAAEKMAIDDNC